MDNAILTKHAPLTLASLLRHCDDGGNVELTRLLDVAAEQLDCLARVHAELDGQEWDSGTTARIAEHLEAIGLSIAAVDCDDEE